MTRRLQGRGPAQAAVIVGAVALLATGCTDTPPPSALTYCATQPPPPAAAVVVDDAHCDRGEPGFGLIEYQVPPDYDGGGDSTSIVILGVGQSVPYDARARSYSPGYRALPRGTTPRVGSAPARAVRPPTAATGRSSTITRGGLGVASSSSSAGKGGSSGS